MTNQKSCDMFEVCYLCGNALAGKIDRDHVPMKQLYGKAYRQISNPDLFCLPTHSSCNHSFQSDEDYFVYSLAPVAKFHDPGSFVAHDIEKRAKNRQQIPLLAKVLEQFEKAIPDPAHGMRYVPIEGSRIGRVVWKIARGLYFKETGQLVDESLFRVVELYTEDQVLPEPIAEALHEIPGKGDYPSVFDYRYIVLDHAHTIIMSIWNCFTFLVLFHLPNCPCDICTREEAT